MPFREHERDIRRMIELLNKLLQLEGRSQRSVEQELGLGSSGMSKILKGVIRLQVSHVLMILEALEIPPGQFFRLVYPEEGREHPTLAKLREAESEGAVAEEEEDSPDFDARVRRALLRLLSGESEREP